MISYFFNILLRTITSLHCVWATHRKQEMRGEEEKEEEEEEEEVEEEEAAAEEE